MFFFSLLQRLTLNHLIYCRTRLFLVLQFVYFSLYFNKYHKTKVRWIISIISSPGEELRNGVSREDGGSVTISNTLDVRLKILIIDDRDFRLERVSVRSSIELEPPKVLSLCVPSQYLPQNPLLDSARFPCHLLDELKRLRILLACWRAKGGRELGINRHC